MKILQLGKFYPIRGGVEKVMWDLTRGLAARGVSCDMLCAAGDGEKETRIIPLGETGRVIVVPALFKAAATMITPQMISWLRKHRNDYDIIHIHHPDPMACLALWLSGYKGRVILHWHSDILSQRFLLTLYRPLQSWLIRRAERIVGTTPVYVAESPWLQRVQDKVTYVPIGIEPVPVDEAGAARIREKYKGKKLVFSLGRLVPYKGFAYLVEAARYLDDSYHILIGGSGPLRGELQERIDALGLTDRVTLLGYLEDAAIPALFGACDVFVLSSVMKTEAFGIVQIEAMSAGKPVIATRIPHSGVSWVNEDGVSGVNVAPENALELAKAIQFICNSSENYRTLTDCARKRFMEMFTSGRMIDGIMKLYGLSDE